MALVGGDPGIGKVSDAAWVAGDGTVISILKGIAAGGGGGGPVTIADGADVAEGATADVKVVGDSAGTVSAKLRGINTALAGTLTTDVTDRVGRLLGHVTVDNATLAVTQSTSPWVVSGTVTTGGLTDTQLRATPVPVSGTVSATQGTSPWVVSGTVSAGLPALGQALMAASLPVVIASDQSPIPITGSISATSAATATDQPPIYTEGVSEALSQDLAGDLRTVDVNSASMRDSLNDLAWNSLLTTELAVLAYD